MATTGVNMGNHWKGLLAWFWEVPRGHGIDVETKPQPNSQRWVSFVDAAPLSSIFCLYQDTVWASKRPPLRVQFPIWPSIMALLRGFGLLASSFCALPFYSSPPAKSLRACFLGADCTRTALEVSIPIVIRNPRIQHNWGSLNGRGICQKFHINNIDVS